VPGFAALLADGEIQRISHFVCPVRWPESGATSSVEDHIAGAAAAMAAPTAWGHLHEFGHISRL